MSWLSCLSATVEAEAPRQFARLRLGHVAERKAQIVELLARGREQEIALVAIGVGGAEPARAMPSGSAARRDVVAGRQRGRRARARSPADRELDRAVALDAGHRRLARA
jgi:hypothetical protein